MPWEHKLPSLRPFPSGRAVTGALGGNVIYVFDPVKALDHTVTLAAAFAGAWIAFRFERSRRNDEEIDRQVSATNRALYTIFNLWNIQEQFRKEIIEPWRGKHDAWFNMPAYPPVPYGISTFDAEGLSFLLNRDATLYSELLLEEQRFASAMGAAKARSDLLLNDVWPSLATAGVKIGTSLSPGQLETIIGADKVRQLTVFTAAITDHVDDNLKSLTKLHDSLRSRMSETYPLRKFARIDFTKSVQ